MYLSYSGFKKHHECNLAYYHQYIAKTRPPEPDNRVNMLYGSVVGTLFEEFYNGQMWKDPHPVDALLRIAPAVLQATVAKESKAGVFDYKRNYKKKGDYTSHEDILKDVEASIPRGLDIIRQHWLLGVGAAAEVKLDAGVRGHTLGGRADFIMRRVAPYSDVIILDGKGSKYRDQYVDVRQLHWYAMLHREKRGFLPEQVGFVFWRFEPNEAIDWHPVPKDAVDELMNTVLETASKIEEVSKKRLPVTEAFPSNPSAGRCRLCSYSFTCPAGQAVLSSEGADLGAVEGVEDVSLG